jgi:hypothetical protein
MSGLRTCVTEGLSSCDQLQKAMIVGSAAALSMILTTLARRSASVSGEALACEPDASTLEGGGS